jgi:hypothetical protein
LADLGPQCTIGKALGALAGCQQRCCGCAQNFLQMPVCRRPVHISLIWILSALAVLEWVYYGASACVGESQQPAAVHDSAATANSLGIDPPCACLLCCNVSGCCCTNVQAQEPDVHQHAPTGRGACTGVPRLLPLVSSQAVSHVLLLRTHVIITAVQL